MRTRSFGQMLRAAAVAAGLTQAELAELVGLSREAVGSHMRGVTEPNASQMASYSEALGVRWLIGKQRGEAASFDLQWAPSDSNRQPTDSGLGAAA